MLFSVLIAHYNNTRFLPDALSSVLNQTHRDWEIILVDDRSTEDFTSAIGPFVHDDRIRVFRNEQNMGCGYTKNRCASLASGTLMGFLDPDDILMPNALERLSLMHRLMPLYVLIYSTHYVCDENLTHCRPADYVKALPSGVPYLLLNDGRIHHFATFKRAAYLQTPGIDKKNQKAVDQDLYYLLEEQGPVAFLDEPLYKYRIHSGGISTSGQEAEATRWHLLVIMNACKRRLSKLKSRKDKKTPSCLLLRKKLVQTKIQYDIRTRNWGRLIVDSLKYPFNGGTRHLLSYGNKILWQGPAVLNKSFRDTHSIKP